MCCQAVRAIDWLLLVGLSDCRTIHWDVEKSVGGLASAMVFTHHIWPVAASWSSIDPCESMSRAPTIPTDAWRHSPREGQGQACRTLDTNSSRNLGRTLDGINPTRSHWRSHWAPDTTCSSLSSLMSILKPFLKALKSCKNREGCDEGQPGPKTCLSIFEDLSIRTYEHM